MHNAYGSLVFWGVRGRGCANAFNKTVPKQLQIGMQAQLREALSVAYPGSRLRCVQRTNPVVYAVLCETIVGHIVEVAQVDTIIYDEDTGEVTAEHDPKLGRALAAAIHGQKPGTLRKLNTNAAIQAILTETLDGIIMPYHGIYFVPAIMHRALHEYVDNMMKSVKPALRINVFEVYNPAEKVQVCVALDAACIKHIKQIQYKKSMTPSAIPWAAHNMLLKVIRYEDYLHVRLPDLRERLQRIAHPA